MELVIPHASDWVRRILTENHIMAITFPPHRTNLFQALDFASFQALRQLQASATGEFDDDSVNAQISTLIQTYEQTATSSTIRRSLRKAGLEQEVTARSFKLEVVKESLRENPGFRESRPRCIHPGFARETTSTTIWNHSFKVSDEVKSPLKQFIGFSFVKVFSIWSV
jgi:hypothetical protein